MQNIVFPQIVFDGLYCRHAVAQNWTMAQKWLTVQMMYIVFLQKPISSWPTLLYQVGINETATTPNNYECLNLTSSNNRTQKLHKSEISTSHGIAKYDASTCFDV